ncbi:MAG TPA: hypothetical protein VGB22_01805 [candidate division Zixibacteria bacterium]|jgi:hypothetical protein
MAENLLSSLRFTYDGANLVVGKPPGFPAIISVYLFIAGGVAGFHFVQITFLYMGFVFAASLVRAVFGTAWGVGALLAMVLADPIRYLAYNLMSEPPFFLLTFFGLWAAYTHRDKGGWYWPTVAGIAFAMSTYVRPINLFWPIALTVVFWICKRNRIRWAAIVLIVHTALILPWIVRTYVHFGRVVPMVANWSMLYYMTSERHYRILTYEGPAAAMATDEYQSISRGEFQFNWGTNERFRMAAIDGIQRDPAGYLWRCVRQFFFTWFYIPGTRDWLWERPTMFWLGRLFMIVFYVSALAGAWALRRRDTLLVGLVTGYVIYTALVLFPVRTEVRYLLTPMMTLMPLAFAGLHRAWQATRSRVQARSVAL